MTKKLAIFVPRISDAAPCKLAIQLGSALSIKDNYEVDIYYLINSDSECHENYSYQGIIPRKIDFRFFLKIFSYEILNSHCIQSDIFVLLFSWLFRGQWIVTLHCDPKLHFGGKFPKLVGHLVSRLWIWAINKANRVVVLNESLCKYVYKKENAVIISNGLDVTFSSPPLTIADAIKKFAADRFIVGSYGVIRDVKGFDQLISVASILPSKYCIVIAGSGPLLDEYKMLVLDRKLHDKVLFLGHVKNAHNILRLFDCFVIPSRTEGFPLAIIEAYSAGVQIIKSNIPQLVSIQDASIVYSLDNIDDLLQKIIQADLEPVPGASNIKLYQESFSLKALAERYDSFFSSLDNVQ